MTKAIICYRRARAHPNLQLPLTPDESENRRVAVASRGVLMDKYKRFSSVGTRTHIKRTVTIATLYVFTSYCSGFQQAAQVPTCLPHLHHPWRSSMLEWVSRSFNNLHATHIRQQGFRNMDAPLLILIIFHDGNQGAASR